MQSYECVRVLIIYRGKIPQELKSAAVDVAALVVRRVNESPSITVPRLQQLLALSRTILRAPTSHADDHAL